MKTTHKKTLPSATVPAHPAEASPAPSASVSVTGNAPPAPVATAPAPSSALPSEAVLQQWIDTAEELITLLGDYASPLTIGARQRLLKPKAGGDFVAPLMLVLLSKYKLALPGVSPADVQANVDLVKRLQPVATCLHTLVGLVDDSIRIARSNYWRGATSAYTMLSRAALDTPNLQVELQPASSFFATKHKNATPGARRKRKPKAPKVTAAASPKPAKPVASPAEPAAPAVSVEPPTPTEPATPAPAPATNGATPMRA